MARRDSVEVTRVLSPNSQLALRLRDADVVNLCTPKKTVPHAEDVIDLCTPQERSELNVVESNAVSESNSNILADATNRTTPRSEKYEEGLLELKNLQQKKESASSHAVANDKISSGKIVDGHPTPEGEGMKKHLESGAPRSSTGAIVRIRISNLPYLARGSDLYRVFAEIHGCQNIVECYTAMDREENVFFGSVSMPEPIALNALRSPYRYWMQGRSLWLRRQFSIYESPFCTYSYANCNDHPPQKRNHCAASVHGSVLSGHAESSSSRKIELSRKYSPNDLQGHNSHVLSYSHRKPNDRWQSDHNSVGGFPNSRIHDKGGHNRRSDGRGYNF